MTSQFSDLCMQSANDVSLLLQYQGKNIAVQDNVITPHTIQQSNPKQVI